MTAYQPKTLQQVTSRHVIPPLARKCRKVDKNPNPIPMNDL
jgi:hypothetical protein